jgi:FkbM family methyltransferase
VANYKSQKNLIFENVGSADNIGDMDFCYLPSEYNEPEWLQQIGTFDRDAIEFNLQNFPNLINKIETKKIRTITLEELFRKNNVSEIDLLIIDAEGLEYKILIQLKYLVIRPAYILFEWGCMKEDVQINLFNFLKEEKYKLYSSGGDILAVLRRDV